MGVLQGPGLVGVGKHVLGGHQIARGILLVLGLGILRVSDKIKLGVGLGLAACGVRTFYPHGIGLFIIERIGMDPVCL